MFDVDVVMEVVEVDNSIVYFVLNNDTIWRFHSMAIPGFQELFESRIKTFFMYGATRTGLQWQKLFYSHLRRHT